MNLKSILVQVAQEEGFTLNPIEPEYNQYYIRVDQTQGDRCVDDRSMLKIPGYPYSEGKYTGIMLPGGTLGLIDALRYSAKISESEARQKIGKTYQQNSWRIGGHIDDEHGHIKDVEVLKTRNNGCGDQDKKRTGKIPMFKDIISPSEVDSRFVWIRENGFLPALGGEHTASAAAVNLIPDTTYNNQAAVPADRAVFNADLWAMAQRAGKLNQSEDFIKAVIRNYCQTLKALTPIKELQLRESS